MASRLFERVASLGTSLSQWSRKKPYLQMLDHAPIYLFIYPLKELISFIPMHCNMTTWYSWYRTWWWCKAFHTSSMASFLSKYSSLFEWIKENVPSWPWPVHPRNVLCFRRNLVFSHHVRPACLFPPGHWWSQSWDTGERDQAAGPGHGIGSRTCGPTAVCCS